MRPLDDAELGWADVVAVSGMHPQRPAIRRVLRRARDAGCRTVLGGPSASVCPEYYPEADAIHAGELGDATERLVRWMAEADGRAAGQRLFRTEQRTPIEDIPLPALHLAEVDAYFTMPLQFSVGCPFACEFCDIPVIYGRKPRAKSPGRVLRELQAIYDLGHLGAVVFVDDNLLACRKALEALLPALVDWQRERGHPFRISTEATLDLARHPQLLAQMREARITHLFFGVESPEPETLRAISKRHNTKTPILDALGTVQGAGIEALVGLILGFDTDPPGTAEAMTSFVEAAQTPIVYFNLLTALPGTPLWERLDAAGRLEPAVDGDLARGDELLTCLETNVRYVRPSTEVKADLLRAVRAVYAPERVYARFAWNAAHVYGKQRLGRPRIRDVADLRKVLGFAAGSLRRVLWMLGVRSPDRAHFWRFVWLLLCLRARRRIGSVLEHLLLVAPTAHHLVTWARELEAQASAASTVSASARSRPPTS